MSDLRTPFEIRGYSAPWTRLSEGLEYMDSLIADSPNLSKEVVGESVEGAPMVVYKLGVGTNKIFIVCQQHGEELSGREAMFTLLRELAHTTDQRTLDYLEKVTILAMPTAHPDNDTTRENSNGVNINRDHVKLTQPETLAIHSVIQRYQPDLVIDVHEGRNISNHYATSPILNNNVDKNLLELSKTLENEVKNAVEGLGYTWERYQGDSAVAGPEYLNNNAGVQNKVSILLESRRYSGHDNDADVRFTLQKIALETIFEWHHQNVNGIHNAVKSAQSNITQNTEPLQLITGTLPPTGEYIDPLPTGYLLNRGSYELIKKHRKLFAISSKRVQEGWFIPLSQPSKLLIAYLLDPQSPENIVVGARDYRQKVIPYALPTVNPADLTKVIGYKFNLDGVIMYATILGNYNDF